MRSRFSHDACEIGGAIQMSEFGDGGVEPGVDVGFGGDVDDLGEDLGRGVNFSNGRRGGFEGFFAVVGEGEEGTAGGEKVGRCQTDS